MAKVFPFSSPPAALVIDAVYEGGTKGNTEDNVLGKLIPGTGNQGGFRAVGSWNAPRLLVLYSSMDDRHWPRFHRRVKRPVQTLTAHELKREG